MLKRYKVIVYEDKDGLQFPLLLESDEEERREVEYAKAEMQSEGTTIVGYHLDYFDCAPDDGVNYVAPVRTWTVKDWHSGLPTATIKVRTNDEALEWYLQKYKVNRAKFHLIEAKLA